MYAFEREKKSVILWRPCFSTNKIKKLQNDYFFIYVATVPVECCNLPLSWGQLQHLSWSVQIQIVCILSYVCMFLQFCWVADRCRFNAFKVWLFQYKQSLRNWRKCKKCCNRPHSSLIFIYYNVSAHKLVGGMLLAWVPLTWMYCHLMFLLLLFVLFPFCVQQWWMTSLLQCLTRNS